MSIKSFPGNGPDNLAVFLFISVLIHLIVAAGFISLSPKGFLLPQPREKAPIIIDVVDLPSDTPVNWSKTKNPAKYLADRNESVEKETFPESEASSRLKPSGRIYGRIKQAPTPQPKTGQGQAVKPTPGKGTALKKEDGLNTNEKTRIQTAKEPKTGLDEPLKKAGKNEDITKEPVNQQSKAEKAQPKEEVTEEAGGGQAQIKETRVKPPKPNLFLTDDRISELTRQYESDAPKGEKGKTLQLNTSESRYQKYLLNMRDRILRKWDYPLLAAQNGWHGVLRIDFVIKKDGTLGDVKLLKSSGYPVLDDAAITAIKLAEPFPPFPDNFDIEEISIKGNFEYVYRILPQRQ
ncbi:MAG: energy transducer TonB [Deltaproteobacteria bacterium]|nr:energy transducer TonB [Deltaproteobacteria bacterium]